MPVFGIQLVAAGRDPAFEKEVEFKKYRNEETGRDDKFVSLPSGQQTRIYETWKSRQQPAQETSVEESPAFELDPAWTPLEFLEVNESDIVAFELEGKRILGEVVSVTRTDKGEPVTYRVQSLDPQTWTVDDKHLIDFDAEGTKKNHVLLVAGDEFEEDEDIPSEISDSPVSVESHWKPVRMDDVYEGDWVVFDKDGKKFRGLVSRTTGKAPDVTSFKVVVPGGPTFEFSEKDIATHNILLVEEKPKAPAPFAIKPHWKKVRMHDIFDRDVIAYEFEGKPTLAKVVKVTHDKKHVATEFRVHPIDPHTGATIGEQQYIFNEASVQGSNAVLVPMNESPLSKKPIPLTPEEKAKIEAERLKKEKEEAELAEKKKKAREQLATLGEPVKKIDELKEDDVVAFQDKGVIHYGRVIETSTGSASFLYINPEDGKITSTRYDKLRFNDLSYLDVHKVPQDKRPEDPRKHNIVSILKTLVVLPEEFDRFFKNLDQAQIIDMKAIKPAKVRLKGVMSANELMASLIDPKGSKNTYSYTKRDPISLIDNEDGTYTIRDGNSTYTNAAISKWTKLPAIVKTKAAWKEFDRLEEERRKQEWEERQKQKKTPEVPTWLQGWTLGEDSSPGIPKTPKQAAQEAIAKAIQAYRPLWQETPGYKTVVTVDSEKGILPSDREDTDPERGQSNLDAMWPVELGEAREKERALPLPSNFDKKRDKKIGPTYFNKPRNVPYRTRSEKGEEYGHPTKYDYNYVRRRQDVTAALEEDLTRLEKLAVLPLPNPAQRQKGLPIGYAREMHRWYLRNRPQKKLKEKLKYRTQGKRDPQQKLYRKYYRMYPDRYRRRGKSPLENPAERSKAWREKQKQRSRDTGLSREELEKIRERMPSKLRSRKPSPPGRKVYGQKDFATVVQRVAANWPQDWGTAVKQTVPPDGLSQNHEPEQPAGSVPRKDSEKQKGESLRAPDLTGKPQKGLQWEILPKAPGGMPSYTTNNPGNGSGKVIPMWGDFRNNTQQIPDEQGDQYLRNNNYDVKVARTLPEILTNVDPKTVARASGLHPALERTDTKNWMWTWKVGDHTVKVQAFKHGAAKTLPHLNLRVSCSCPAWRWWGSEHWASEEDYLKGELRGSGSVPVVRDPDHQHPVCKHAYAVLLKSTQFFVQPDKNPLKKLGSRFSLDKLAQIEVEIVPSPLRVAAIDVARRYFEGKKG